MTDCITFYKSVNPDIALFMIFLYTPPALCAVGAFFVPVIWR